MFCSKYLADSIFCEWNIWRQSMPWDSIWADTSYGFSWLVNFDSDWKLARFNNYRSYGTEPQRWPMVRKPVELCVKTTSVETVHPVCTRCTAPYHSTVNCSTIFWGKKGGYRDRLSVVEPVQLRFIFWPETCVCQVGLDRYAVQSRTRTYWVADVRRTFWFYVHKCLLHAT